MQFFEEIIQLLIVVVLLVHVVLFKLHERETFRGLLNISSQEENRNAQPGGAGHCQHNHDEMKQPHDFMMKKHGKNVRKQIADADDARAREKQRQANQQQHNHAR